ncbi:MAG: hypothetical protein R3A47_00975 [Polyangiales bacterium]
MRLPTVRADVLLKVVDPWTQKPIVRHVYRATDLYDGPHIDRAPDLLIESELDEGYSYNVMPSRTSVDGAAWNRLEPSEYLGKKGRSLAGSHQIAGFCDARFLDCMRRRNRSDHRRQRRDLLCTHGRPRT